MNAFIQEFETHFREGFIQDLQTTFEKLQNEKVYACAFGTDGSWKTLFFAVNTEESLKRHIENMKDKGLHRGNEQDDVYFRWGCSEFQYGDGHFNHLYKLLNTTKNVHEYQNEIVKTVAKVVNETDTAFFSKFGQSKEDITFFMSITDDDGADELENRSVVLMTSEKLADEFLGRYFWLSQ
jgi:hypothetical protein